MVLENSLLSCPLVDHPESHIQAALPQLAVGGRTVIGFRYQLQQYYLPDTPDLELLALVELRQPDGVTRVLLGPAAEAGNPVNLPSEPDLMVLAATLGWPLLDLTQAVRLQPIAIAKPWGQEIWYTGIEARGQSKVTDGRNAMPLPWLLSLLPEQLTAGRPRELNLLKILDPLPEEVFGDLYFELHEEKQEVYVVTHVDRQAWPDGTGGIRIGFDAHKRAQFRSDSDFVQAFREAVKAYETVRRRIDALLDECRIAEGIGLNEPVSAAQTKLWLQSIPAELVQAEQQLRQDMDKFKATLPLDVGSVLKVPCHTPHSLLHGVRTIEFQTPVYERQILSFAQKVLTQDHWDTDQALACMNLGEHQLQPLRMLERNEAVLVEEVVAFSDFDVWRITLQPSAQYQLQLPGYALVIGVTGVITAQGRALQGEEACLLAASALKSLSNRSSEQAVALVSFPKVPDA